LSRIHTSSVTDYKIKQTEDKALPKIKKDIEMQINSIKNQLINLFDDLTSEVYPREKKAIKT
jgi:hypothetical protein